MLKNVSCSDITPYEKDQLKFEFWSQSITPNSDRSSLSTLYDLGFVTSALLYFSLNAFWNSFHNSLEINKCSIDRRRQVLSIIANDFNYEVIKKNLDVSNDLICAVRKYTRIYRPRGLVTNKPVIRYEKMLLEKNAQLQSFLIDKANVIMSSYKTDLITNELDIENAIKGIKGTSVANLNPIWDRGSAELDKFCKKDINKPTPQVSTHTTPSSEWEMLMPNSSRKRISPEIRALLEGYFLAGNINKSNRYTAQDMHDKLVQHAQKGEIKVEEVSKVAMIQN
ncbi:3666_t:CDS:2 [Scutellospora calospora]|uniref:3666_t:CDS:1 n=1 Tax=Scutellospora calospora TaxID=85575 RepID=A0ACA9JYB4_9GLOM|nr:3666_t:CDS:2 [Scutellospora calospora]